jgi:galactoside O-acetyltransferase
MSNQAYQLPLAAVGQDVVIWPLAKIVAPEVISIGDSVIIDDFVFLMGGKRTAIGSFVHIAVGASVCGAGEFIMEDFSGISGGVRIYTSNDDFSGNCLTGPTVPFPYRIPFTSFVHVKKHAVIGAGSVVLPGVAIGEGAVVGACSLVRQDCEPWTFNVGTPAKPLPRRRPKDKVLELEAQLRRDLYDAQGRYICLAKRGAAPGGTGP